MSLNDSSCAPAHNTPFPLERSPPASFKRMLGCTTNECCYRVGDWQLEISVACPQIVDLQPRNLTLSPPNKHTNITARLGLPCCIGDRFRAVLRIVLDEIDAITPATALRDRSELIQPIREGCVAG